MIKAEKLVGKKVLLLSPYFFSYELKIKNKMEEMGAEVFLFDERAIKGAFSRALLTIVPFIFIFRARRYFKKIVKQLSLIRIDYVIVVKCDMIDKKTISLMRNSFKNAKFCLYLWDSKKNIKGIENKISLFDIASSFDRQDCEKDQRLLFRPLFYIDFPPCTSEKSRTDLCFCGTIHSDRYFIIKKLFDEATSNGLTTRLFGYLQAKFIFYYYKVFTKGFKKAKISDFSFEKKPIEEIIKMENESAVVLDIQDPKQSGLTMRTIEMVGAKKRFITTNKDIANYDFYNEDNISIVDRKNPRLDVSFFSKKYRELPDNVYKKYSLEKWILDVLGD